MDNPLGFVLDESDASSVVEAAYRFFVVTNRVSTWYYPAPETRIIYKPIFKP